MRCRSRKTKLLVQGEILEIVCDNLVLLLSLGMLCVLCKCAWSCRTHYFYLAVMNYGVVEFESAHAGSAGHHGIHTLADAATCFKWQWSTECGTLQKINAVQTCQFEMVAMESLFFNLIKLVKVQFISCWHEMRYYMHFLFAMRECILPIINMHYTLLKLLPCFFMQHGLQCVFMSAADYMESFILSRKLCLMIIKHNFDIKHD